MAASRVAFLAACKDRPEEIVGTTVLYDGSTASIKRIQPAKSNNAFHVHFNRHAVHGSGSFCTDTNNWNPTTKPQSSIAKVVRSMRTPQSNPPSPIILKFLHLFLANVDKSELRTELKVVESYRSNKDNQFSNTDYTKVDLPQQPKIYFGPRSLFHRSSFCADKGVTWYLDIPNRGTGGLNEDTAIKTHNNPSQYAATLSAELRYILRQLLPDIPSWTSMKQLSLMDQGAICSKLRDILAAAERQT